MAAAGCFGCGQVEMPQADATTFGQSFANTDLSLLWGPAYVTITANPNNYRSPPQFSPLPWNTTRCDRTRPQTAHAAAQTLMLDGSVRGISAQRVTGHLVARRSTERRTSVA